jgi:serine/threonine-protein kinase/endoribonuclease IRE1
MNVKAKSIKWNEEALLGRGCQGTVVYAGQFNGRQVAVKRILLHNAQLVQRELDALLSLRHPHIVELYYVEKDAHFL